MLLSASAPSFWPSPKLPGRIGDRLHIATISRPWRGVRKDGHVNDFVIQTDGLTKRYGKIVAVDGLSLEVR